MGFPTPKFTDVGKNLQLKAIAGQKIQFKSMVIGDGELSEKSIKDLTKLVHQVKKIDIVSANINDNGMLEIIAVFDNKDVINPFYFREIGIVASELNTDDDILYCYTNCGTDAEKIESIEVDYVEKHVKIVVNVGDSDNVSVVIQPGVYVTVEKFTAVTDKKLENADILNDFDGYITWLSRTSGTDEQKRQIRPSLNIAALENIFASQPVIGYYNASDSGVYQASFDESTKTTTHRNIFFNNLGYVPKAIFIASSLGEFFAYVAPNNAGSIEDNPTPLVNNFNTFNTIGAVYTISNGNGVEFIAEQIKGTTDSITSKYIAADQNRPANTYFYIVIK